MLALSLFVLTAYFVAKGPQVHRDDTLPFILCEPSIKWVWSAGPGGFCTSKCGYCSRSISVKKEGDAGSRASAHITREIFCVIGAAWYGLAVTCLSDMCHCIVASVWRRIMPPIFNIVTTRPEAHGRDCPSIIYGKRGPGGSVLVDWPLFSMRNYKNFEWPVVPQLHFPSPCSCSPFSYRIHCLGTILLGFRFITR